MSSNLITFQTLQDQALAEQQVELLRKNGIPATLEIMPLTADNSFVQSYALQLQPEQLERAIQLMHTVTEEEIASVPADYYLYDFTKAELLEVVAQVHEWSELDVILAKKLLEAQGENLTDQQISTMQQERMQVLAKADQSASFMIGLGYFCAILGGFLGVIIGMNLLVMKKILPDGSKVYTYPEKTRAHGKRILILGSILFLLFFLLKVSWEITKASH